MSGMGGEGGRTIVYSGFLCAANEDTQYYIGHNALSEVSLIHKKLRKPDLLPSSV
jgi:hypothetical protein